jgi:ankyrin repeat protein
MTRKEIVMSGNSPSFRPTRRLPRQPNLEQLRKQAKDLLEEYRAGKSEAVAEVQQFERHPDPAKFALNDAQRVLARAYGYESWPRLKALVDGVNVARLVEAVQTGDVAQVRILLNARPELVGMDMAANDEHRALHYAVLRRDVAMVRLLMQAGADARKGIFPHRDATSALAIARDREYDVIVAVIEEEERLRRELSAQDAAVELDQINTAISRRDRPTAISLLQANASLIHACDLDGGTPLHIAAHQTDEEMVAWLLARHADPRKRDVHGLTAVDRAALAADPRNDRAKSFPSVAKRLLEHGAEMTIHAAVALADAPGIRQLIHTDPGLLRKINPGGGLVTLAVNHGHLEIVRLLLDLGADVDERIMLQELEEPTFSWGMPLWYAALAGQRDIAELLLDRGADPNANVYASGWPLRNAWGHKDDSVKRLLLERGARVQPYMVAEAHDAGEAKRLLEDDASEHLARELVWSAAGHGCPAIVELALPRLKWPADDPAWHWILIQPIRGATADRDNQGHFTCMEVLLRHGIDPNVSRFGQTGLHFAAAHHSNLRDTDRARFASILLDHGARLDLRDELLKSTPLGWACRWGRKELVELLIARGAPVDEPDAESWAKPKAWAEKMKQDAVLAVLREHGY